MLIFNHKDDKPIIAKSNQKLDKFELVTQTVMRYCKPPSVTHLLLFTGNNRKLLETIDSSWGLTR